MDNNLDHKLNTLDAKMYGEKAEKLFTEGYNCAQAVVYAFNDILELDDKMILSLSSSFGGGMGRLREVCGAVTGALMVLGLLYGQKSAGDTEGRNVSNKVNDLMMDRFKEKCGSYICNDLLGCDITSEEGHQFCVDNKLFTEFCPKMVAAAVEVVEEIILEQK